MKSRRYGSFCFPQLLLAVLLFHPSPSLDAQSLSATPAVPDTNAQTISVIVTGHNAGLLSDLKTEDFRLTRGSKPLAVTAAQLHDDPACIGILLDKSGSMRPKIYMAVRAIMDFVRASNPADRFFVVNFNDSPYLDQDFTADSQRIESALIHHEARGGTALYDAVWAAADHLQEEASCKARVLLVVTDGGDNDSRKSLLQTVEHLKQLHALSFFLTNISDYDSNVHASKRDLEALAGSADGALVSMSLSAMDKMLQLVVAEMRNRYTLTYSDDATSRGGALKVKVSNSRYKELVARVEKSGDTK